MDRVRDRVQNANPPALEHVHEPSGSLEEVVVRVKGVIRVGNLGGAV